MKSEQQKKEQKLAARIAKNRQAFEAAGLSPEQANAAAGNREAIDAHNKMVRASRRAAFEQALGPASAELAELIRKAVKK